MEKPHDGAPSPVVTTARSVLTVLATVLALWLTLALFCSTARQRVEFEEDSAEMTVLIGRQGMSRYTDKLPKWFLDSVATVIHSDSVSVSLLDSLLRAGDTVAVVLQQPDILSPTRLLILGMMQDNVGSRTSAESLFEACLSAAKPTAKGIQALAHHRLGLLYANRADSLGTAETQFRRLQKAAWNHYDSALQHRLYLGQAMTLQVKSDRWWARLKLDDPRRRRGAAGPPWWAWLLVIVGTLYSGANLLLALRTGAGEATSR
jgi:hypothetical protein